MPNQQSSMRLFPRGFLGGNIKPQIERSSNPYNAEIGKHQYIANDRDSNGTSIAANPIVEGLYSDYIKNFIATSSFDFRKQVLAVALSAFGTPNFAIWFTTQYKSPAAGDLHNRFLDDTLKFINTGSRDMSLETWQSLLLITDEGNNIGAMSKYAKDFFGIQDHQDVFKANTSLIEVVQKWCSKEGGLEDLLGTLHILFGNV